MTKEMWFEFGFQNDIYTCTSIIQFNNINIQIHVFLLGIFGKRFCLKRFIPVSFKAIGHQKALGRSWETLEAV